MNNISITLALGELAKVGGSAWRAHGALQLSVPSGARVADSARASIENYREQLSTSPGMPARESDCLVPLAAPSRVDANLICVHPAHGTVYDYRFLAERISANCGVYGLHALRALLLRNPPDSVSELAWGYANELLRHGLPEKPFVLYGGCAGGFVALDLARRLSDAGRPPAALVLGEVRDLTPVPEAARDAAVWVTFVQAFLPLPLAESVGDSGHPFWRLDVPARIGFIIDAAEQDPSVGHAIPLRRALLSQYYEVYLKYVRAFERHQPQPYDGRAVYLKAATVDWKYSQGVRACLSERCVLREAEGNHVSLFRAQGSAGLAALLQQELDLAISSG